MIGSEALNLLAHLAIAIGLQLFVVRLSGSWWGGAVAGSAWVISREITQAEYRWIEQYGGGLRANMPWWGGLDPAVWPKADQWIDWIVPTIAVCVIATVAGRKKKGAP